MSERNLRWRVPAAGEGQKHRPPHRPSRRITPPRTSPRRSGKQQYYYSPKPVKILKRCLSEPMMLRSGGDGGGDGGSEGDDRQRQKSLWGEIDSQGGVLYRPRTCTDVYSASPSPLMASSPWRQSSEGYDKEAKVVVNVTVEGSPGPVKTMVKLGSSVEDTIKIVVEKYGEEGRTPRLDRDAASSYELHHSYFSLQCLDKSELIGEVGSRSFYLRRSSSSNGTSHSFTSRFVQGEADAPPPVPFPSFLFPSFIARKLDKIARRTHKIWKIVVCWQ